MANKLDIYFPDEIVNNILIRLPRKSISRFRCVSKHWNRLILNRNFKDSRSCEKIFLPPGRFFKVIGKSTNCVIADMVTADPCPFQGKNLAVGGTFNGIVLLTVRNPKSFCKVDIMLYNPLTRVYNKVPEPPPNSVSSSNKYSISALGFGHSATRQDDDDLKIVTLGGVYSDVERNAQRLLSLARPHCSLSLFGNMNDDDGFRRSSCRFTRDVRALYMNVYSFKNKSWNKLSVAEPYVTYSEFSTYAGTFLNGFLYWIITCNTVVPSTRYSHSKHFNGSPKETDANGVSLLTAREYEQKTCIQTLKKGAIMNTVKKKIISSEKLILALDVKKMMFSEIKFPDRDDEIAFDVLGTIKGRLCWITWNKRYPRRYELSVMNDNKQGGFEGKSCLTSLSLSVPDFRNSFNAMCIFDEGKIMMKNKYTKKFIICDLLKDSYQRGVYDYEFESTDDDNSQVWKKQVIEYEQTRVSPFDLLN